MVQTVQLEQTALHFSGPFGFSSPKKSLFHSEFANKEGIYLWVIKDQENNINYIHYVGETKKTKGLARRQKEHFTNILGLNYYVIDPCQARQGNHEVIWNGMWRDKSKNAVQNTMDNYENTSKHVADYIKAIDVYFAPTKFCSDSKTNDQIRKHVEGCIGWNLRNNHSPETNKFYPKDNHIGTMEGRPFGWLTITSDEPITGLDSGIEI